MKLTRRRNIHKTYQSEWDSFRLAGNMDALSVIYEGNFDLLLNYGRKFCNETSLVEDAIQNIFANLIRSRERLGEIIHIPNYLIISHRNELLELLGKSHLTIATEKIPENLFVPEYSAEDRIIEEDRTTRLKKFLNLSLQKLTSHQQEVLYLKYDVDLAYEEISDILNISVESCRTAVYRSIKLIKSDLEALKDKNIQFFFMLLRKLS